ncbi:MAG TPA: GspH/FimT family pseudopilin [Burkholderiaceae bacterium]|jgi:type IV fimbrial biogenesis protein FimT|nr:GspH/FimT family pseudopilin [Burkholderiaceae bacterium]
MGVTVSITRRLRVAGFSMIELMVVLAIAVILLGIGVPSFRQLIQSQRVTTVTNDFFAAILLARSEAIQRGTRVDLVPADSIDWSSGWIVFIDRNGNLKPDAGEHIVFTHGPVASGMSIDSSFTDSASKYIAYTGTGRTRTNASSQSPQLGTVSFSIDRQVRRIKIGFLGRPRSCNPDNDSRCTGAADTR